MIKGIIFDMDGVMIDTENQSNLGWLWAASQKNVEMPLWLIDSFKGAPAKLSQSFFDDHYHGEQDYWEMRTMRTDHVYKIRETEEVPVKPGLHMLLDYIKDNGLKCAVATSTQKSSAQKSLHRIGAWDYLSGVVYGDEVEHGKPEPDIFLRAAGFIGCEPSECVVIEDSINGIKAGHAAGMKVIHIPDTIEINDDIRSLTSVVCHSLSDVPDIIDTWNEGKVVDIEGYYENAKINRVYVDRVHVKKAFAECGYSEEYARITISNRPDLCEFQCNGAMAAAKTYKKAPFVIADEIVAKLSSNGMFDSIESVKPGFINIKVSAGYLSDYLNKMSEDDKYGYENSEEAKTVIVDYGGANAAKPLHVGHLRSAVIGESVKRINRYAGNNTIGDVHLGDWGLQMGLIIEELRDRKPELPYFDEAYTGEYPSEPPFTISELEQIYPAASAKSKEDEEFAKRAHESTLKLQSGDRACTAIWKHIMNVSKKDLKKNYDNLNVSFDLWKGESDAQPYIKDMVDKMVEDGIAYESQGATVVDIAEPTDTKELPPCIVRKSDGAALYATSDLATIVEREKLYKPDTYIYLADKRQELHFTQVFRTAKKAGIVRPDADMRFVGFGTMNGKDGKPFKTRSGGVMRLEHLISDINEVILNKIKENRSMTDEEADNISKIVGLAALKYGDLSNQASKDYVFDVDRFASFEGNTGPYILYTIVRIKSILAKYKETGVSVGNLTILPSKEQSEKALSLALIKFSDVIDGAYKDNAPHKICQYIYEVSNSFNGFYHNTKILAEEDKKQQESYIALITLTKEILETCIDLLGIQCPDRM